MRNLRVILKIFKSVAILASTILVFNLASAQANPEFMVTWKANNYAPPDYRGKIFPVDGTKVDVALELIDSGLFADLSQTEVRWSLNGELIKSGNGSKNFSFVANRFRENRININVINYKGRGLNKQLAIPVAAPEVAISGVPDTFKALLYFFNIQSISQVKFTWAANGNETRGAVERPDTVNLDTKNLPRGTAINLRVTVQSLLKPEVAADSITLTKK